MRTIALALATAALLGRSAVAVAADFDWHGHLGVGQTLEIENVNGRIHAAAAPADEATVSATKTARHGDASQVRIAVVPHQGGVTICAVYPGDDDQASNACAPRSTYHSHTHNDTIVDFDVRVPAGARLMARTVNGGVDAESLASDIDAHAVNGSVHASTTGVAVGSTVNGSVDLSMGRADWAAGAKVSTVNGTITLRLPGALDAHVEASTVKGAITSEFPITVQGEISRRRLDGTIGRGGRELKVSTVNGSIKLLKTG